MRFYLVLLVTYVAISSALAADVKPKYGPDAQRLSLSHEYVQKNQAPDYWALTPYYLPQKTGGSCSTASVSAVLNAIRSKTELGSEDELVTEQGLVDKTGNKDWAARVGLGGRIDTLLNAAQLKGGVTLDLLQMFVEQALKAYGLKDWKVEAVHISDMSEATRKKWMAALVQNEKSADDFIILNMDQGKLTGDSGGGHLSPVGAFDAKTGKVLVMDVDRQWYEPYWSPAAKVFESMATVDSESKINRGYLRLYKP